MDRNVPTEDMRKQNILIAMRGISMIWKSIMLAVIYKSFAKCAFGIASSVNNNDNDKDYEYVELQRHLDCPSGFVKILDVDKSACTTDNPGLSLVLVIGKEEETEETWLLPSLIPLTEMP